MVYMSPLSTYPCSPFAARIFTLLVIVITLYYIAQHLHESLQSRPNLFENSN
ncbi:uncharacterized protein K452DRAFT_96209 [Aplosporella prunicola CBS 121167]|uniref:Uncharacterized protein n=1 Tax=Aplosporella prunicola CBS 121167 TaxID=1176127 RepID=A0A6A6B359_9PEZI|nr:uncharacterized protein K452DRAFT_96209 [Aplosporella prunicola CBS 121167]KAF2137813.1 hypothetical protein K452DRAFT_96209 [Aplosporella prunicola CBS 121167]